MYLFSCAADIFICSVSNALDGITASATTAMASFLHAHNSNLSDYDSDGNSERDAANGTHGKAVLVCVNRTAHSNQSPFTVASTHDVSD